MQNKIEISKKVKRLRDYAYTYVPKKITEIMKPKNLKKLKKKLKRTSGNKRTLGSMNAWIYDLKVTYSKSYRKTWFWAILTNIPVKLLCFRDKERLMRDPGWKCKSHVSGESQTDTIWWSLWNILQWSQGEAM